MPLEEGLWQFIAIFHFIEIWSEYEKKTSFQTSAAILSPARTTISLKFIWM